MLYMMTEQFRKVLQIGQEHAIPDADELVLVAILNAPRDLEIAQTLGWYRIPLVTAPKTIRVDWIAFYLPASFGDHKWSVRYLAEVRGHELRTRRELLFKELENKRVDEPYFKIQLGPVFELYPPIPSRTWRRFTFLYTTGERLMQASDVKHLTIPHGVTRTRLLREHAGSNPPASHLA